MCGRFTMTRRDKTEPAAQLGVPESELGDYTPRFNIAPTQPYFVLKTTYESREAIPATWGLVNSWAKEASQASKCINARAETVHRLPSYRDAFKAVLHHRYKREGRKTFRFFYEPNALSFGKIPWSPVKCFS